MHLNGDSYSGRTESNSGMKACQFPIICHAGNYRKLPVMSVTETNATGNDCQGTWNALAFMQRYRVFQKTKLNCGENKNGIGFSHYKS